MQWGLGVAGGGQKDILLPLWCEEHPLLYMRELQV